MACCPGYWNAGSVDPASGQVCGQALAEGNHWSRALLGNENDRLPSVVYVKFEKAAWQLDGIDEPGVYPIRPVTEDWYLDGRRSPSVLKIKRRQVPLSPAYAMTAHASQGKTLAAVLLDLNVDKKVDTTFGTVAASRVRCREDLPDPTALSTMAFPAWHE